MPNVPHGEPSPLKPKQARLLEGFVGHYREVSTETPTAVGYYDQTSAYVREALVDKFEVDLSNPQEYYAVMAGLSIGTTWVEELIDRGLTPHEAAEVLRTSLGQLSPPPSRKNLILLPFVNHYWLCSIKLLPSNRLRTD